uniref:Uncharacterized protein n=1 Tax=Glossina pallidipes TaxID=7398 RepID=A0A1A9ZFZ6_GLOPL
MDAVFRAIWRTQVTKLCHTISDWFGEFDGNFENWLPFWELFKRAIDENKQLPVTVKYTFPSESLIGRAEATIPSFTPTRKCYNEAIQLLLDAYGELEALETPQLSESDKRFSSKREVTAKSCKASTLHVNNNIELAEAKHSNDFDKNAANQIKFVNGPPVVQLPWQNIREHLSNNTANAEKRLYNLTKKLIKNDTKFLEYDSEIWHLVSDGLAERTHEKTNNELENLTANELQEAEINALQENKKFLSDFKLSSLNPHWTPTVEHITAPLQHYHHSFRSNTGANSLQYCVVCLRSHGKSAVEPRTVLPSERVTSARFFETTGVDFVDLVYIATEDKCINISPDYSSINQKKAIKTHIMENVTWFVMS